MAIFYQVYITDLTFGNPEAFPASDDGNEPGGEPKSGNPNSGKFPATGNYSDPLLTFNYRNHFSALGDTGPPFGTAEWSGGSGAGRAERSEAERSGAERSGAEHCESEQSAAERFAPLRCAALRRCAVLRAAPPCSTLLRSAPLRVAPLSFAPLRSALLHSALLRSTPLCRSVPLRECVGNDASECSTSCSSRLAKRKARP